MAYVGHPEGHRPAVGAELAAWLVDAVDRTSEYVGVADRFGNIVYMNASVRERFGYADRDLAGVTTDQLFRPEAFERYYREIRPVLLRGETWSGEIDMRTVQCASVQVALSVTARVGPGGEIEWLVVMGRDVTARRELERNLERRATHDPLTGLANRTLLLDRLDLAAARASRRGDGLAVVYIDLDHFKDVNDRFGHLTGDRLLREAARRISGAVRPADTVTRLGGDEFVVLCEEAGSVDEVLGIAERVCVALGSRPFTFNGVAVGVTASVGVSLSSQGDLPGVMLVHAADVAMYRAKQRGRARVELAWPDEQTGARRELVHQLAIGIGQGHMKVLYQPMLELRGGVATGVEALPFWEHPTRGWLAPDEFLLLAEEAGLATALGLQVLRDACHQACAWERALGASAPRVHVDLCESQLADAELPRLVEEMLARTGLEPSRLCLELPEAALIARPEPTAASVRALKALGVSLSVDHFAGAPISLELLEELPIDELKVEAALVGGLSDGSTEPAMLRATVDLAQRLALRTVADGVASEAQLAQLRGLGYDVGQGSVLAAPEPATTIVSALRRGFDV